MYAASRTSFTLVPTVCTVQNKIMFSLNPDFKSIISSVLCPDFSKAAQKLQWNSLFNLLALWPWEMKEYNQKQITRVTHNMLSWDRSASSKAHGSGTCKHRLLNVFFWLCVNNHCMCVLNVDYVCHFLLVSCTYTNIWWDILDYSVCVTNPMHFMQKKPNTVAHAIWRLLW